MAPVVQIDEKIFGPVLPGKVREVLDEFEQMKANEALKDDIPCITGDKLRLFDKAGKELFSVSFGSTIDDFWEPAAESKGIGVVLQNGETANYSIKTNRMVKTNSQLQAPVEGTIVAGDSVFAVCSNNLNTTFH